MKAAWLTAFLVVLVWSGIAPKDYLTWLLEVSPAVIGLAVLALTWRTFRLTTLLYVLINNAGTSGPLGFPECSAYSGLDNTDYEIWRRILEINLLGAFKVATAFHDHVAKSKRRVLVNMSSDLGSVAQNTQGDLYNYRSSKAGLNIVTKGFGNEWPDIISIAMAPGWCQTELGGTGAEIDPADSVREQIKTIDALTLKHSGAFINRFGESVPC